MKKASEEAGADEAEFDEEVKPDDGLEYVEFFYFCLWVHQMPKRILIFFFLETEFVYLFLFTKKNYEIKKNPGYM